MSPAPPMNFPVPPGQSGMHLTGSAAMDTGDSGILTKKDGEMVATQLTKMGTPGIALHKRGKEVAGEAYPAPAEAAGPVAPEKIEVTDQLVAQMILSQGSLGGVYVSSSLQTTHGWFIDRPDGGVYLISVSDWIAGHTEALHQVESLSLESNRLHFATTSLDEDPVLGPLLAMLG